MLVLRPVINQQQEPGGGQALDQAVQQGLGLGIDPVQILEDQQQRLHLTFTEEQALEAVERPLAPLGRIKRQKRAVRPAGPPGGPAARDRLLEGLVERQDLPRHSGAEVRGSSRSSTGQ